MSGVLFNLRPCISWHTEKGWSHHLMLCVTVKSFPSPLQSGSISSFIDLFLMNTHSHALQYRECVMRFHFLQVWHHIPDLIDAKSQSGAEICRCQTVRDANIASLRQTKLKKSAKNEKRSQSNRGGVETDTRTLSINLAANRFSQAIKLMRAKTRIWTCNNYRRTSRPPAYTPGAQEVTRESRLRLITISTPLLSHLCRSPVLKLMLSPSSQLPVAMAMGRFFFFSSPGSPPGCVKQRLTSLESGWMWMYGDYLDLSCAFRGSRQEPAAHKSVQLKTVKSRNRLLSLRGSTYRLSTISMLFAENIKFPVYLNAQTCTFVFVHLCFLC